MKDVNISTSDLSDFLPHRTPMVWVDRVTRFSETEGECIVEIKEDALYLTNGLVRRSSYIEFMAQSFGFINAAKATNEEKLSNAFLVGFDKFTFSSLEVGPGDRLTVKLNLKRQVGPVSYIEGIIYNSDKLVCHGQLKLFAD